MISFANSFKASLMKYRIKFAILMSSITTFFVTFVLVSVNLGFQASFLFVWMRSWAIATVMVSLSIMFLAPILNKYLSK